VEFLLFFKIKYLLRISPPEEEEYPGLRGEVVLYRCSSCGSLRRFLAGRMTTVGLNLLPLTTPPAEALPLLFLLPSDRRGNS